MMIESVRLHGFRNYDDEMITFPKAIILLYGKNGQGKTNLLESLYMGASASPTGVSPMQTLSTGTRTRPVSSSSFSAMIRSSS